MVLTLRDSNQAYRPATPPMAREATAAPDANDAELYRAFASRDARFDGRFFVGVSSTGVYCRPVCRVRTPLQRNCRFFGNAAAAESAGFRPCLLCRPELAPGLARVDSSHALAQHAARLVDSAVTQSRELAPRELAARLGVSDRHLRRIFVAAFGVSPIDYLTTRRLLMAKQLLTDTELAVTQVALASGFSSVRRFNDAFAQHYALCPSALRRRRAGRPAAAADAVQLRLGWRPPYDVTGVFDFIAQRALTGVETVAGLAVTRTLELAVGGRGTAGWVTCRFEPDEHVVHVAVAPALAPVLGDVTARVRHWLDLDADPQPIAMALASLPVDVSAGPRLVGGLDGFETAVRVVLGQQVSLAAGRTLTQRLADALGRSIDVAPHGLNRLFPTPQAVASADAGQLAGLGIAHQRVQALQALAGAVAGGRVELHPAAPLQATLDALRHLPGLGEWSVQMIAMRALGWPDAFASGDAAVQRTLGTRDARQIERRAQAWRPWRAYAQAALMRPERP
jgi:AraC family transcriptional regulator of adaptative response / DNA-3-methyladenine glycosylase II